jgi:mono/diheme cytochrome c family protein
VTGARRLGAAAALALTLGAAPSARGEPDEPTGEALFLRHCATCHLGRGGLIYGPPPPQILRDPLPHGDSPEALAAVIRHGTGRPIMPAFERGLSDAEIAALVDYILEQRARSRPALPAQR